MSGLSAGELVLEEASLLPSREALALLNINVLVPVNTGLALNVLTINSNANAFAGQYLAVWQR